MLNCLTSLLKRKTKTSGALISVAQFSSHGLQQSRKKPEGGSRLRESRRERSTHLGAGLEEEAGTPGLQFMLSHYASHCQKWLNHPKSSRCMSDRSTNSLERSVKT